MNGLRRFLTLETNKMVYNHVARQVSDIVQQRINALKIGQKMQDLPEELWHESFRYYVKEDKTRRGGPNMRLIRLNPNAPSLTVTGYIFNKFVHPYENRYITVREAARLQGFPDEVEFKGTLTSTQQQVGNAVPVQLAEAIFQKICTFAGERGIKKLNAFSLFCGAGGLDIGAYRAKSDKCCIKTLIAIDCWNDACNTLRGYLGTETKVIEQDITAVSNPLLFWREKSGSGEKPDLVFGGPPCQAFSQAGKQKALNDPRGMLIYDYLRFIDSLHPKFFLMENVSNIQSIDGGKLYQDILCKMGNMNYNVSTGILCAADYGAPQMRRRAIFIGTEKSLGQVYLPEPLYGNEINLFQLKPYMTVGEAFDSLPVISERRQES